MHSSARQTISSDVQCALKTHKNHQNDQFPTQIPVNIQYCITQNDYFVIKLFEIHTYAEEGLL